MEVSPLVLYRLGAAEQLVQSVNLPCTWSEHHNLKFTAKKALSDAPFGEWRELVNFGLGDNGRVSRVHTTLAESKVGRVPLPPVSYFGLAGSESGKHRNSR